jgi:hypothetical protein
MDIVPYTFLPAGGDQLVLLRPKGLRALLFIVNTLAVGVITFAFNRQSDAVSGIPIPAAGNSTFENAIPQGDLHVFAPVTAAGGVVLIGYINI